MMQEQLEPVKVTVSGGGYGANTLVFGVLHDALCNAGFNKVSPAAIRSFNGQTDHKRIPSLLDVCRSIHPDLFNTPVDVQQELDQVRFTDDELYPTTAALEETIHKAVRNDYVDYYTVVEDSALGDGRHGDDLVSATFGAI
jgi:hypothetical protein